jgi:hypothetical protein
MQAPGSQAAGSGADEAFADLGIEPLRQDPDAKPLAHHR